MCPGLALQRRNDRISQITDSQYNQKRKIRELNALRSYVERWTTKFPNTQVSWLDPKDHLTHLSFEYSSMDIQPIRYAVFRKSGRNQNTVVNRM
jgi:hypothetical protein